MGWVYTVYTELFRYKFILFNLKLVGVIKLFLMSFLNNIYMVILKNNDHVIISRRLRNNRKIV